ncbi:agmatinase family protein [Mechercharimyces sp. CAU 1602]|uniref:agmatinase family protein n=1 Tax=Mechercharimyces sp. CAU 1602 TaxID=2973933 RepID=UPI0021625A40|nr:agmatinase family protein [Mechercharimyces sp. CAU 1602]MCS1351928.1 agmatinase family protein [Mechercharimyces sp. CAU 1602]
MKSPFVNIVPPALVNRASGDRLDHKVSEWIQPWDYQESLHAGFIGLPLSRSSISASAASETPNALRASWKSFATYDADHDVDLSSLCVRDIGDIRMHTTDIKQCHRNIAEGLYELYQQTKHFPHFMPLIIGGDHSITRPSFNAFVRANNDKKVGLIQFDTHFDVRVLDQGASNGTPIRGLIEEDGVIEGKHIYQLGIHSFANSAAYKEYVVEKGITFYTMNQVRRRGLQNILSSCIEELKQEVDLIYVTVDIDVLDLSFMPGSPGPSPGGMVSWDLFEAVYTLGLEEKVGAFDLVCLDPFRDVGQLSVKTGTHTMLSFLAGYTERLQGVER